MKIETFKHNNVLPDGTLKDGEGEVEVNGGIVISAKGGGCGIESCKCSEGHWITIIKPRTKQGVVEGTRVVFENEEDLNMYLKREHEIVKIVPEHLKK